MELSTRLVNGITSRLTHVVRNGDPDHSYPGCVNLSFAFVEGESLLMALKDVALSSGRWVRVKAWIEKSPHRLLFVWNNSPFSHRPYPGYYSRPKTIRRQWLCPQKNFFRGGGGGGVVNKVHYGLSENGESNFWVCAWNPMEWPFKENLSSSAFTWYYFFSMYSECVDEILWCDHKWNLFSSTFTCYYLFSMQF